MSVSAMFWAVLVALLHNCKICSSEIQNPELTQCPTTKKTINLEDLVVRDLGVGRDMTVSFAGVLDEETAGIPAFRFQMWNSQNIRMPCVDDFGSCTYKACGGTTKIEKLLSRNWNNTCPIPPGTYSSSITARVIPAARFVRGNGTFRIKAEVFDGEEIAECKMWRVYLAAN
ncbi:uncharacterized protein LOC144141473 [Haemaphysalis longicornis]